MGSKLTIILLRNEILGYDSPMKTAVWSLIVLKKINYMLEVRTGTPSSHCINLCFNLTMFILNTVFFIPLISKRVTELEKVPKRTKRMIKICNSFSFKKKSKQS